MKRLLSTLGLMVLVLSSFAQDIVGDWYGVLKVPGAQLNIVYHFTKNGDIYSGTMDSPDQKAFGIKIEKVEFSNNKLELNVSILNMKYVGTYLADSNKISGKFSQGPFNTTLDMKREKGNQVSAASAVRPQDPVSFPYKREEVTFTNPKAGNTLAGTLTMPENGKVSKIVILVTGSGPQNRNEDLGPMNHRPFLVWSDWLTRQGIAVLRYDDRGIAKSTGNFQTATTADFADDAEAAVAFIRSRADLKSLSIGILGHSEGGMVAPIVAARNKEVKFIVSLAGPGIPISELMVQQNDDILRLSGVSDSVIENATVTNRKIYELVNANKDLSPSSLKLKIGDVLEQQLKAHPQEGLDDEKKKEYLDMISTTVMAPWFRYFIGVKPVDYWSKVKCPVLALNGTLDVQVKAEPNLAAIKSILQKNGNKKVETVALPGLNHLFQKAVKGSVAEYEQIEETVNPAALTKVSNWINQL